MSALLHQRLSTEEMKMIFDAFDDFDEENTFCNGLKKCPTEISCYEHTKQAFLKAFENGEISFE